MKRNLKVLVMMLLFICISTISVFAGNITFNVATDKQNFKAGENVELKLEIKDISDVQEEINTVVGYVQYDENLFEEVGIEANANCGITYNSVRSEAVKGHFIMTFSEGEGVKSNTQLATLKLKVKENVDAKDTEIAFKNLVAITENTTVNSENQIVKLKIGSSNILKTICTVIAVIVLAVVILATIVVVLIKANVIKLSKKECNCKKENCECKVEEKQEEVKDESKEENKEENKEESKEENKEEVKTEKKKETKKKAK